MLLRLALACYTSPSLSAWAAASLRPNHPPLVPPPPSPPAAMQATIDQVDGLIRFTAADEPLAQWDKNIQGICHTVNGIVDQMAAKGLRLDAA